MLRVNQLAGFGGAASTISISSGTDLSSNNPSFTVDLGSAGPKQVLCAFACFDGVGDNPWTWGTGTVGGESFSYVVGSGEESAGNGSNFTGGATIRAIETSLGGSQTITIPIVGYSAGAMDTVMLAVVLRGVSVTPLSYDGGSSQGSSDGDDLTLNTSGARIVIAATSAATAPGNFQGPGTETTLLSGSNLALGYDLSPAGGGSDVYSFSGGKYTITGAAFG
jgi:hypothetical protein